MRSSASAIASPSSAPVAPITSSAVLSASTMSDSAASACRSLTGAAATRSTASSIAVASADTWGNPLRAAEPRSRWVTTARFSSVAASRGACPSAVRPSSTAARVSHASIKNTLSRNCRSPSTTISPLDDVSGGQLEPRKTRRESLGDAHHLVHGLPRLERRLLGLDRHARDGLDGDRAALDVADLFLGRLRDVTGHRGRLPRDLADLGQAPPGPDGGPVPRLDLSRAFLHRHHRLLRLHLDRFYEHHDVLGGLAGALGELADLFRHDREAEPRPPAAGALDRRR